MQNPSSTFYWNDWDQEPGLRLCSLAAQGLWMRCLCVMARARPAGYLLIGTRPCTPGELAELVGKDHETVTALLDELGRNEVFATTRRGTIYNRRMVREAALREKRAKSGRIGGIANQRKIKRERDLLEQNAKQTSSKVQAPLVPSSLGSESVSNARDISSKPEHGTNIVASDKPKRRLAYPEEFEVFWDVYPQRPTDTKRLAFLAWQKTVKSGVDPPILQAGAERYAAFVNRTGHESMLVATWCSDNRQGWTASYAGNSGNGHGKSGIVERVASRLRAEGKDLFGSDGPLVEGRPSGWRNNGH